MNFQELHENLKKEIENKLKAIELKKSEISILEVEIYKIQGATEMLVYVSKELEAQQEKEKEPQALEEPIKTTDKK